LCWRQRWRRRRFLETCSKCTGAIAQFVVWPQHYSQDSHHQLLSAIIVFGSYASTLTGSTAKISVHDHTDVFSSYAINCYVVGSCHGLSWFSTFTRSYGRPFSSQIVCIVVVQ
jgi:hypothetical protein